MILLPTPDGSLLSADGRIVYYSIDRFIGDIVQGECCFICGARPGTKVFNDEHVMPQWLLRRHRIHWSEVNLPNDTGFRYRNYTIPCCQQCNTAMARRFEEPISSLTERGIAAVGEFLRREGPLLMFQWLALVFLKLHLKDRTLRLHQDRRMGDDRTIADLYTWEGLHHLHCVVRSFHTGCALSATAMGSFCALPAVTTGDSVLDFDFGTVHGATAILLRTGSVVLIAVIYDACAGLNVLGNLLGKVSAPLSIMQCRELLAHFAYVMLALKERPRFRTQFAGEHPTIVGDLPAFVSLREEPAEVFGRIMDYCCRTAIQAGGYGPRVADAIRAGRYSFLVDGQGNFSTGEIARLNA